MSEYAQDDFDFDADPLAAADFDDAFDTSDFEPPPLPTCGCGHPWYTHGLYGCGAGAGSALLCPCAATGPAPPGRPQDEPVAPATTAEPLQDRLIEQMAEAITSVVLSATPGAGDAARRAARAVLAVVQAQYRERIEGLRDERLPQRDQVLAHGPTLDAVLAAIGEPDARP